MPVYEYRAVDSASACDYCRSRFEVRQGINDEPLEKCPRCGSDIRRVISRPFLSVIEPLSKTETFSKYTEEEAESRGLLEGFAPDVVEVDGEADG